MFVKMSPEPPVSQDFLEEENKSDIKMLQLLCDSVIFHKISATKVRSTSVSF